MSEAITSAGTLWVLRQRIPHLRLLRLRSPSQVRLGRVAGPRTVGAYHSEHLLWCGTEKRRCSPTRARRGGGADVPGPKSGVHGLAYLVREGTACTKVLLQSRVLLWRWFDDGCAVFLPGRWYRTWTCSLVSSFCSSACGWVSPFGPLVFVESLVARLLRPTRLVAPRGGRRAGSCCPPVFRVAPGSRCGGTLPPFFGASVAVGRLSLVLPGLRRFPQGLSMCAFLRRLPSCGVPARWRDLRYVVSAFAASSFPLGGQLQFQETAERRGLHGLRRAVEPRDPQQVSPPRKVGGRGASGVLVWSHRGGNVSTLRVGVRHFAGLCQGTQTRTGSTREKKDHILHKTHTESAPGTGVHEASLGLNPRRYVKE